MAHAEATGQEFLGRETDYDGERIVYIAFEMEEGMLKEYAESAGVKDGEYQPGQPVSSLHQVAQRWGVAVETAARGPSVACRPWLPRECAWRRHGRHACRQMGQRMPLGASESHAGVLTTSSAYHCPGMGVFRV